MNYDIKKVVNIIIAILLIVLFFIIVNQNSKSNEISDELHITIKNQEETISELKAYNNKLNTDNENLSIKIEQLEDINYTLQTDNELLESEIIELISEIEKLLIENEKLKEDNKKLSEKLKENNTISTKKDFKSYMSYKAITNKSSKQWKLQQQATTNEDGIRCIDGIPMVAVGTGWGLKVGDIALVTCENGNSFKVIVGDIKDDKHTDAENKTTVSNGCRCEFIVEPSELNSKVRRAGNVAVLDKYKGYVINIEKV